MEKYDYSKVPRMLLERFAQADSEHQRFGGAESADRVRTARDLARDAARVRSKYELTATLVARLRDPAMWADVDAEEFSSDFRVNKGTASELIQLANQIAESEPDRAPPPAPAGLSDMLAILRRAEFLSHDSPLTVTVKLGSDIEAVDFYEALRQLARKVVP